MAVNRARWRNLGDVMMNLSPSLESESVTTWTLTQLNRDDVARTNTRHFGKSKDILNIKIRAFIVQAPLTQRTEPTNENISWLYLLLFSKNQTKSLLNYLLSQADEHVWHYDLRSTIVEISNDTRKISYKSQTSTASVNTIFKHNTFWGSSANTARYEVTQVLITSYYGIVYPYLSYGVTLWGVRVAPFLPECSLLNK